MQVHTNTASISNDGGYFYEEPRHTLKRREFEYFASMVFKCATGEAISKFCNDAYKKHSPDLSALFIGYTLKRAVKKDRKDIITHFVSEGAEVNFWIKGESLLHEAVTANNASMVKLLLSSGIEKDILNKSERTPVMLAARAKPECLKVLLEAGCAVDRFDSRGYNALHQIFFMPDVRLFTDEMEQCLDMLVKYGVDVSNYCEYGKTSLHKAVERKMYGFVGWLIRNNAKLDKPVARSCLHYLDCCERQPYYTMGLNIGEHGHCLTPLFFAIFHGNKPLIDVLISCGCSYKQFAQLLNVCAPTASVFLKLKKHMTNQPSLKTMCRNVIRQQLSSKIVEEVKELGLPSSLQEFVLCTENLKDFKEATAEWERRK